MLAGLADSERFSYFLITFVTWNSIQNDPFPANIWVRNQLNDGPINQIQMLSIFNNSVMAKKISRSLTFSEKKLTKYFPDDYTAKDMEQVIESLLEKWMQEQSC